MCTVLQIPRFTYYYEWKEKAETEANVMKHALSNETEEKLEDYINKTLSLEELDCDYDENNEKCKSCIKIKARNRMRKELKREEKDK